ncbi:MAG: N(2)-acetyl-L-2,4-diaminobutanoate deacetylase DoeB2 [Halothiobacillaceae bacterium]
MQPSWKALIEDATQHRRALHRRPELSWQEERTAADIRQRLETLQIPWQACAGTGTIGQLAPQAKGPQIALRADIDALPIVEATGHPWASQTEGRMHACGHDGHTAVLLAVAAWLKARESELPGPVRLIFQPAEEGGHGAEAMIRDGALEGVDRIFGWHNWPAIPFGQAVCPDGPVMSANGVFEIQIAGRGAHASQPEVAHDPLLAATDITQNLQQIVARRLPPQSAAVVSVTQLHAGDAITAIPDTAWMAGSVRVGRTDQRDAIVEHMRQIVADTARAHRVEAEFTFTPRYGATVNHAGAAAHYRDALAGILGPQWQDERLPVPIMASEDFSYYLQEIPGAFALIGANDGDGPAEPCHSPRYDFNDRLLDPVGRLLVTLAGLEPPAATSDSAQENAGQNP